MRVLRKFYSIHGEFGAARFAQMVAGVEVCHIHLGAQYDDEDADIGNVSFNATIAPLKLCCTG